MEIYATESDTVTVHYRARTRDGGVIEDTSGRKPLVLNLSDDQFLPAFRKQIVGMTPGETKTIILEAEESFGLRDYRYQMTVPRECLPSGAAQGDQISTTIQGEELNLWIVQLNKQEATLDMNHPLAGESLELSIQLVSVNT